MHGKGGGIDKYYSYCELSVNEVYAEIFLIVWCCLAIISVTLLCMAVWRVVQLILTLVFAVACKDGKALLLLECCYTVPDNEKEKKAQLKNLRCIIRNRPLIDVFVFRMLASKFQDPMTIDNLFKELNNIRTEATKEQTV